MRKFCWWSRPDPRRHGTPPLADEQAESLKAEIRALHEAITRLGDKVEQAATTHEPPATLRNYANENNGAITLLALIVAIAFGIGAALNSVNADLKLAGRWVLLLTIATAMMIGVELVGVGLRATGAAWDAVADQGLERRPKIVSVAAAVRLTLFVGLIMTTIVFVGFYGLVAEPSFSLGVLRYYGAISVFLLLPDLLGRWAAWVQAPRSRALRISGAILILLAVLLIVWMLIKP